MAAPRFLGITVLADFVLNEGVDAILDNITQRAGATAVAINPTVTTEVPEGQGSFQPPSDAGSSPRLFDRPLWGKRALWVRSAPSYRPNLEHYEDCSYGPRQADELSDSHGGLIGDFIEAALARGLKVYFQIPATAPSGLRDADRPRLPDGRLPQERMADTGCLASSAVRAYNRAYVADLLEHYPQVTGFRPDWPEYPCYKLDEAFQDFSDPVKAWAQGRGFAFAEIRREVAAFYHYLHGSLTNRDLEGFAGVDRGKIAGLSLLRRFPAVMEWLRLKAALSVDLLDDWCQIITDADDQKELSANAFMSPFNLFTGFDYAGSCAFCDAISPKLYTMHWSVIVEFWGRVLLERNPGLDEGLLTRALAHLFDLGDQVGAQRLGEYGYPGPDEPHPIPDEPQARKIAQVLAEVDGGARVTPLMHGYGPAEDFARRFAVVARSRADGVWINRYGYLSDEKLDMVGDLWRR